MQLAGTRRSAAEKHPPGSSTHSTSTKACATAARIVRSILCQLRQASISGEASQVLGKEFARRPSTRKPFQKLKSPVGRG